MLALILLEKARCALFLDIIKSNDEGITTIQMIWSLIIEIIILFLILLFRQI